MLCWPMSAFGHPHIRLKATFDDRMYRALLWLLHQMAAAPSLPGEPCTVKFPRSLLPPVVPDCHLVNSRIV